jgi:hypothetical protein
MPSMPVCEMPRRRSVGREYRERATWKDGKESQERVAMEMESTIQHLGVHHCVNHKDALGEFERQSDRVQSHRVEREITNSVPQQTTM